MSVRHFIGPRLGFLLLLAGLGLALQGAPLPPAPTQYMTDYAHVLSPGTVSRLNQQLEEFERKTSSQVVVAVFPKLPPDTTVEEFAVQAFQAWKIGQKGKDNGVGLFVFVQDRRMRFEVGYGLEGALPDALAKRIIDEEIRPQFQRGDFNGGISAGVQAVLQAIQGEYRGTGRTVARGRGHGGRGSPVVVFLVIIFLIFLASVRRRRGTVFHRGGRTYWGPWGGGWSGGGWSGGSGGGWSGGGGGGGWSGGGGFSGGGGRSGGGGASGGW
jgi:uncharacterized protein